MTEPQESIPHTAEPAVDPAAGKTANLIYILYLAALIFGITAIIGVVIAYVNRADSPAWVASHYQFQIRTFWIGLLLWVLGGALAMFVIGWLVLAFTFFWWIIRCAKGMKHLAQRRAHLDPTSWMFG